MRPDDRPADISSPLVGSSISITCAQPMVFLPLSVCDERSINSSSRRIHRNTCKRAALPASSTTAGHCLGIAQLLHSPNVGPAASRTPSNPLSFIVRRSPLALLKPSGWMERECGDEYRVYQQVYLSLPGSTSQIAACSQSPTPVEDAGTRCRRGTDDYGR